ncbi:cytochrome P450 [Nonomuraea sp. NPDC050394]|uniref:cytochrome P450 n=1 Tax=Nonomuraea sp. NPDC050394 TaxID=3364363 RepID=UPI0037AD4D8A
MTESVTFPHERLARCPFDPPAELASLREQRPIARLAFADGHQGWLVTSHSLVREVLADPRFTSRYELMHHPLVPAGSGLMPPAPVGDLSGMDAPGHTRYRKLLTGQFTVRRMRQLTGRVEEVTAEHLDAMRQHGPPLDLLQAYAQPIPAIMICEVLGVPYADRDTFRRQAADGIAASTPEKQFTAFAALSEYIGELVRAKRADPTDDVLSDLTDTDLTDEELTGIGTLLLGAGLDTTANMIALGTFALLQHPAQLTALRENPGLADKAVEELLRYLTIAHTGIRAALQDVELNGHLIKKGETVVLAANAANRDPAKFPNPDTLDLNRQATGHLAFAHGIHQCIGQQLARVELRTALPALLTRFPGLRLAVAPEDVPMRTDSNVYGVRALPVTF